LLFHVPHDASGGVRRDNPEQETWSRPCTPPWLAATMWT
jgi:hypothetical protein